MNALSPRPSLLADLRSFPRPLWVLIAGVFINRFGAFVWPFLTVYLIRRGFSLGEVSIAVSAFGFGALGGGILGGWLSDHIGRRNTIVAGTFGSATSVMLLYQAQTLPWIIVFGALIGVCAGTHGPAASALLADLVPDAQRVRAYATLRIAGNAGFACGTAVGGVLVNYSLFWLFAGDALTTALYGCVALLWLPHGRRGQTHGNPWSSALRSLRENRAFHSLWIGAFASACVAMQFATTYALHVQQRGVRLDLGSLHLGPESLFGLLMSWNGIFVMIFELPLTVWTLRFDARRVMALGYLLSGFGFALNGFVHTLGGLFVAMTIFSIGEVISAPTASALVARIAPENLRGRYMGALALSWNFAGIVAPQIGFHLFAIDPLALWLACAVLGIAAAWSILRTAKLASLS